MRLRFGSRYQSLAHGLGCRCHAPAVARINERLQNTMSRRSALKGIAASFAAVQFAPTLSFAQEQQASLLTNLRIFDGRAAKLIEQMEKEGIVSQANHVGKREVLTRVRDRDED